MPQTLQIGGVPEHFNLPWQLAQEQGLFAQKSLAIDWHYYKGGTGEMVGKLQSGELDMAILLTEGFLAAAAQGLDALIVKEYIVSPLVWGIFTGTSSPIKSIYSSKAKRIAISRKGSGSHLMALIHAEQRGDSLSDYSLVEIKSMQGAVDSLVAGESDVFYWEKYTTKPHVTSGELRMIGEFSAPWSGFLIVANKHSFETKKTAILDCLTVMNEACANFKTNPQTIRELTNRFDMSEQDSRIWLDQTVWKTSDDISLKSLENAKAALRKIDASIDISSFQQLVASHLNLR
jgi:sulfonate transport system substrate-binding protein